MNFSSQLIEEAVNAFATLPGIGKKTALRLTLHLLKQNPEQVNDFCSRLLGMKKGIKECKKCHHLSDHEICSICKDPARKEETLCIVESIRDVMAIEDTGQFKGRYHVLGGVISPLEGVGPETLNIDSLKARVASGQVKELIMAISPNIEGDTTIFYLSRQLAEYDIKISTLSRGISFGGELEYADEITLGRSIQARIPYQNGLSD